VPRPKTLPDQDVLKAAYTLMHERGPEALTFATVSEACGLSASTLVQRFKSKDKLVQATLLYAWDQLDAETATLSAKAAKSPAGAIKLLAKLSGAYGGIEAYANGLLVLREDVRDPALRARGTAWKATLAKALDACFAGTARAPHGIGLLMATHWQGSLLWWSFDPNQEVADYVEASLKRFVAAVTG
jgi:AcrR family transcriptional regulator